MSSTTKLPTSIVGTTTQAALTVDQLEASLGVPHGSTGLHEDSVILSDGFTKDRLKELAWWKRPAPWWLLVTAPLVTVAYSATIAPRIEIYTYVACREHRPDTPDTTAFNLALPITVRYPYNMTQSLSIVSVPGHRPLLSGFLQYQGEHSSHLQEELPCAADPVVQAAAAKLIAIITTTMGILTCLTTGFWGSFSDRYGRTRVMSISLIGALVADFVYISIVHFFDIFPGGSWFLLVAPIAEGLLGGLAAGEASMQSYMADVTDEGDRSRFFSLTMGLMLVGIALGPTLGSLLIANTHNILSVFYFVAILHAFLVLWAFFLLPESVSKEQRQQSKEKYFQEIHNSSLERRNRSLSGGLWTNLQRFVPFLRPLSVFLPHQQGAGNPLKKAKSDWSLTLVALSFGSAVAIMACYPFKLQYAAATFNWDSVNLGYFIGLVGLTSGLFLTLVFPIITKLLKPKPVTVEILDTSSTPPTLIKKEIHSSRFDINLVKASLLLNIVVYCLIGLNTSALGFTVLGMVGSFGLGISPAMQSVALASFTRQGGTEVGRLFGGLGVVSAISSQFFGPFFYGIIYAKTVASHPRTIFFVCAASLTLALLFITLIRIPKDGHGHKVVGEALEESDSLLGAVSGSSQTTASTMYGAT